MAKASSQVERKKEHFLTLFLAMFTTRCCTMLIFDKIMKMLIPWPALDCKAIYILLFNQPQIAVFVSILSHPESGYSQNPQDLFSMCLVETNIVVLYFLLCNAVAQGTYCSTSPRPIIHLCCWAGRKGTAQGYIHNYKLCLKRGIR